MTRKRFTKLLMAQGYSRNEAARYATRARVVGHSYEEEYYLINIKYMQIIGEAVRNAMQTISKIVNAVGAGVTAFYRAYADAMKEQAEEKSHQ